MNNRYIISWLWHAHQWCLFLHHFKPINNWFIYSCTAVFRQSKTHKTRYDLTLILISYNLRHFIPTAFLCVAMHACWRHDSRRMPTRHTHRQTRTRTYKNYQINTFNKFESVNTLIVYIHKFIWCMNFQFIIWNGTITRGIPAAIVTL